MAVQWSGVRHGLDRWIAGAGKAVDDAVNEDCIRLAVTGLSRAGKTVFITSLIQNLLALGAGRNTLPRLTARMASNAGTRLVGVHLLPAGASGIPYFDHSAKLAALASESPAWPPRTDDIAQVSLALTVTRGSSVGRLLGTRRVRLDILDYPGEWLLDLPLLDQSFAAWSAQTLSLLRQPPRNEVSAPFLGFLETLRPTDGADEAIARRGHELYLGALDACRAKHGLRYLQPGRFLCPGPRADVPFMWFFPMDLPAGVSSSAGKLDDLLEERFKAYKRDMRSSFFDRHFAAFDRQVMLVDVLGALYAGRVAFEDTARAIHDIAKVLRYGPSAGVIAAITAKATQAARLVGGVGRARGDGSAVRQSASRRIEHVAFVATKADHVPALKRDNLRNLVRSLAEPAREHQAEAGASVTFHVAASLLSTEDGTAKLEGRAVEVVRGIRVGEDKVRSFYVGEVPVSTPPPYFWTESFLEVPEFEPPVIDATGENGLPHLGLDAILDDLIGDLL